MLVLLYRNSKRDLVEQRPWNLDFALPDGTTAADPNQAVAFESPDVVLDVLQVATDDLGELIDGARMRDANGAEQGEPAGGQQIPCGGETGEIDSFAAREGSTGFGSFVGFAEFLEPLGNRADPNRERFRHLKILHRSVNVGYEIRDQLVDIDELVSFFDTLNVAMMPLG